MRYYKIYIFIILIVYTKILRSQDLLKSRKSSYYTYIYSVENKNAEILYSAKDFVSKEYLSNIVDSFPSDSSYKKELPVGHYVFVNAVENEIRYKSKSINTINADIVCQNKQLLLFVYKTKSKEKLSEVTVKVNGKKVPYNNRAGAFKLKRRKKGLITVDYDSELAVFEFEKERSYNYNKLSDKWNRFLYRLRSKESYDEEKITKKGYVAFNKPKYLPHDTIKFKALIINKNNKYYSGPIIVKFGERYADKKSQIANLNPVNKGAYEYQFVLGDSLRIDRDYKIELYDAGGKIKLLESETIGIEDYQLNENKYRIRSDKEIFTKGEDFVFYVSGKDANGFNVLDGRVELIATVDKIEEFNSDKVFVPNKLWSISKNLDPLGETKIVVSDSMMPSADLALNIKAVFNNSNNETQDTTIEINYQKINEKLLINLDSGYVMADYLLNGVNTVTTGELFLETNSGKRNFKISFPFKEKIDQNIIQYEFNTTNLMDYVFNDNQNSPVKISGIKTKDSLLIKSFNPNGLDIYYTLYKDGKEVEKGINKNISIMKPDKSVGDFSIHYSFKWIGEMTNLVYYVYSNKNALSVVLEQPKSVFPGQQSKIKIKVTDDANNPVEKVNLTAYAINSQFENIMTPGLPYMGRNKHFKRIDDYYEIKPASNFDWFEAAVLSPFWINKFGLDTVAYYKMINPKNSITFNYDSVKTINAQVSPFLYKYGHQIPIYIIYIDDYPVYYYGCDNSDEYVFISSPGLHNFRLRTIDKEYYIDSVLLKKGTKLDFSLDINHLPKNVYAEEKENKLNDNERSLIRNSVISVYNNSNNQNYLWQENNVRIFNSDNYNYYRNYSRTYKFYGIYPGKVNYAVQNKFSKQIDFEPGFDYKIDDKSIKMVENNFMKNEHELSYSVRDKELGLKAIPVKSIKLKDETLWYRDFIGNQEYRTEDGNSTLKFKYEGDSSICMIQFNKTGIDTFVKFYSTNQNAIYNLESGFYDMTFFTPHKYYFKKDSVFIGSDGVLFMRLYDAPSKKSSKLPVKDSVTLKNIENQWKAPEEISMFNAYSYVSLHGNGGIRVSLADKSTLESIPFANIVVYKNDVQVAVATTDMDGNATIKPLAAGRYNIKAVYVGYGPMELRNIVVNADRINLVKMMLNSGEGVKLDEVEVVCYQVPLIDPDTKSGQTVTREEYQNLASKDVNSVAATTAGVYQSDDGNNLTVRGSREGETKLYIDGVQIKGASGLPSQYAEVKTLRNDFSDYAYWKPNLFTDKNGEVEFTITYPDNITKWKSFALAVDESHTGIGYAETKSFKNVLSSLALPRFLNQGDSSIVVGKVLNYLPTPVKLKSMFKVNNEILSKKDTIIKTSITEKLAFSPNKTDSIKLNYSIITENGQKDGEERIIPVLPLGLEEASGVFAVLNGDTNFVLTIDSGLGEIYLKNNPLDFLLEELENLKNYPHGCMEQTASKLNAILMEEAIMTYLQRNFKGEMLANKLIKKLEKGQNSNGSWGWWENTTENVWMTAYILRILHKSKLSGYSFKKDRQAIQFLLWNLGKLNNYELLHVLNTLSEINVPLNYVKYLENIEKDSLSLYQKLMVIKIKQENNLNYDLSYLSKTKKETILNSTFWGEEDFHWYDNCINTTLLAYKIIERSDSNHVLLNSTRNYFLELRSQNKLRNTIETASILESILPAFIKDSKANITKSKVELKGIINVSVTEFPFAKRINATTNQLTVSKTGTSPIYFTYYKRRFIGDPKKKENLFKIRSYFEYNGKKSDTLIGGKVVEMLIEIECKKLSEYVMINIPIPAGCSYDNNESSTGFYEIHREYFKDHVAIFCQQLPIGKHLFKIKLQPRYSGMYHINPVKVEQMYFPTLNGNNTITKVRISDSK